MIVHRDDKMLLSLLMKMKCKYFITVDGNCIGGVFQLNSGAYSKKK